MGPLFLQNRKGRKDSRLQSDSKAVSYAKSASPRQLIPNGSVVNVVCHYARLIEVTVRRVSGTGKA